MTEVATNLSGPDTAMRAVLRELFVINLCASMTPMPEIPKHLKGFEKFKLFQICKVEDGRRRYRLRLGFFETETDAQLLVASLRSMYPAALAACAVEEDLRHVGELKAPITAPTNATQHAASNGVAKPMAVIPSPAQKTAPPPAPAARKVANELKAIDPPPARPASSAGPTTAFHVGRGATIPETTLELSAEELSSPIGSSDAIAKTAANGASTVAATPKAPSGSIAKAQAPAKPTAPTQSAMSKSTVAKSPSTPAPQPPKKIESAAKPPVSQPIVSATIQTPKTGQDDYVPILDTTLTIRTLTKAEAEDPNKPKWFAVQLAVSEEPINISAMPKLDIFSSYSLYSVALMENGGIHHTLRLGFFKEKVSAEAVMGYLKTFFSSPCITQISSAEHERFATPKTAKPAANISQLDERRTTAATSPSRPAPIAAPKAAAVAQTKTPTATRAPVATAKVAAAKQQSFLSRLIGKQLD